MNDKVQLIATDHDYEARIIEAKLTGVSIPFWTIDKTDSSKMIFHGHIEIYVNPGHLDQAKELLGIKDE